MGAGSRILSSRVHAEYAYAVKINALRAAGAPTSDAPFASTFIRSYFTESIGARLRSAVEQGSREEAG